MRDRFAFRVGPIDAQNVRTIREYFHRDKSSFIDMSTAIRFGLQETAQAIKNGHDFRKNGRVESVAVE
jgi:hypothetical protein